jgi:bifunctional NMN adenylyltransferase/nudix hydrolase
MYQKKPSYGFLVGRYQIDDPHDGHKEIIRQVKALHDRVFVFLGVPAFPCRVNNPLDFLTRKRMIEAMFPDLTCLALPNMRTDTRWSKELDRRIGEVAKFGDIMLYGGRDSFVTKYKGQYKAQEIHVKFPHSGTAMRLEVSNRVRSSPDFRAGVIYACQNQYPNVLSTVDLAILDETMTGLCLIHKDGDETEDGKWLWRFPGGFLTPNVDKNKKIAALREGLEETSLDVHSIEYINSFAIDDWRLAGEPDQVFTDFFMGINSSGVAKAQDDADEVKWQPIALLNEMVFVDEHRVLFAHLREYLSNKKKEVVHVK